MNVLSILRDAWFFYTHNFAFIVRLCLPLLVLENLVVFALRQGSGEHALPGQDLLVSLLFYPLYTGGLILFMDARSRGHFPGVRQTLTRALSLWPALAVLTGLGTLLFVVGVSLYLLPGLWVMVRIAFGEFLLVLEGLSPVAALKQSFRLTQGRFLPIFGCLMAVMVPLWLLDGWRASLAADPAQQALVMIGLDSALGLVQLLASVVAFRCFMICQTEASLPAEKG